MAEVKDVYLKGLDFPKIKLPIVQLPSFYNPVAQFPSFHKVGGGFVGADLFRDPFPELKSILEPFLKSVKLPDEAEGWALSENHFCCFPVVTQRVVTRSLTIWINSSDY